MTSRMILALLGAFLLNGCFGGGGGEGTTPPIPKDDPLVNLAVHATGKVTQLFDRVTSLEYTITATPSADYTDLTVDVIFTVQVSTNGGVSWEDVTEMRATGTGKQRGIPQTLPLGLPQKLVFFWDAESDLRTTGSESRVLDVLVRVEAEQATGPGLGYSNQVSYNVDWTGTTGCVVVAPSIQMTKELILVADSPINRQFLAAGGDLPLNWSLNGTLPGTLKLDPTGALTGTPAVGDVTVYVTVADSCSDHTRRDMQFLRIRVLPPDCSPLRFMSSLTIPEAKVGESYNVDLRAFLEADGQGSLSWKLEGNSRLPNGVVLTSTGKLQGTPELGQAGFYALEVSVSDSCTTRQTETEQFLLAVSS